MTEHHLYEALEMAEKLSNFLQENDNLSERSVKAKREIRFLMAPYQQLQRNFQLNAHKSKITSYFNKRDN